MYSQAFADASMINLKPFFVDLESVRAFLYTAEKPDKPQSQMNLSVRKSPQIFRLNDEIIDS